MPFCTACGHALVGTERFCGQCGSAVTATTPPTATPRPATVPAFTTAPAPGDNADLTSPEGASPDLISPEEALPEEAGPRWEVGSGPVPQPPRHPSVRRALLALGLPVVMIAAGLVGLIGLLSVLRSGPDPTNAVPRRVVALPSTTAPGPPATGHDPATPAATATAPAATSAAPTVIATTARQQARAVERLLDEAARVPVTAVASLARCSGGSVDPATVAASLKAAATTRARLLDRLDRIPVDRLPDGAALRSALHETWTRWVSADGNYLTWAQGLVTGATCNPQNPFKLAGDVDAAAAGRAGTRFVARWNTQVARPLRLPPRQARDL